MRFEGEPSCAECGRGRPESGWEPLEKAYDPFLGCIVDERYLVRKRESRGATTTVYRAEVVGEDRDVALKIARFGGDGDSMDSYVRERMSREARAVGKLESGHIVPIFEFLELDNGPAVIVMEYVDGITLADLVRRQGVLPVERAIDIIAQTADGLAEAHDQQLIHRDIKPSNIMLDRTYDDGDFAYLLDFGIVRMHEAATGLTQGFIGTPLYASPEQAQFDDIDFHTDIYSLGATMFFALVGRAPFGGEDVENAMRAHIQDSPPRLTEVAQEREFPSELDELVDRMLAKLPGERPTAEEVVERLDELELHSDTLIDPAASFSEGDAVPKTSTSVVRHSTQDGPGPSPNDTLIYTLDSAVDSSVEESIESMSGVVSQAGESDGSRTSSSEQTRVHVDPLTSAVSGSSDREIAAHSSMSFVAETDHGADWASKPDTAPRDSLGALSESTDMRIDVENAVCFSADAEGNVALVNEDFHIWLFEREAEHGRALVEREAAIADVALSSDLIWIAQERGACIGLGRGEGDVEEILELPQERTVRTISASENGEFLLVGFDDGEVCTLEVEDSERTTADPGFDTIRATAMQFDGQRIGIASESGRIYVGPPSGEVDDGEMLEIDDEIHNVALSSDGQLVAVLTAHGEITIYHSEIGHPVTEVGELEASPRSLFFTEGDELRGLCMDDGNVIVWDCVRDCEIANISEPQRAPVGEE